MVFHSSLLPDLETLFEIPLRLGTCARPCSSPLLPAPACYPAPPISKSPLLLCPSVPAALRYPTWPADPSSAPTCNRLAGRRASRYFPSGSLASETSAAGTHLFQATHVA